MSKPFLRHDGLITLGRAARSQGDYRSKFLYLQGRSLHFVGNTAQKASTHQLDTSKPRYIFGRVKANTYTNRHFEKCLEYAKLRRIRFHDLRHTFASLLIQNGESLVYVKEQLGHSSIKMTVDVYGHLVRGANRQAVNRLPRFTKTMRIQLHGMSRT